jgi:hypothetical protein
MMYRSSIAIDTIKAQTFAFVKPQRTGALQVYRTVGLVDGWVVVLLATPSSTSRLHIDTRPGLGHHLKLPAEATKHPIPTLKLQPHGVCDVSKPPQIAQLLPP